jgi:hypothetical protein
MSSPHLKTRQEFRDSIRRKLGIIPPIDVIGMTALPGDQPTNYPYPTNMQINDALLGAVSDINRECQFHVQQYTVPVAAFPSGTRGPFQLDLSNLMPNTVGTLVTPTGHINDVLRALWVPTGGVQQLLTPANRNALDRGLVSDYYADTSAVPQMWYVEQYSIYLLPAPSEAGTLILTVGTGIVGLDCEDSVIDQVPIDFQDIFEYQAIVRLAKTRTMDVEAQDRAQMFGQDAALGMIQFKRWREGASGTPQPTLSFASYRTGYGTRRNIR